MNDVKVDSNDIEEMYIKYYTPLKRYCMKLVSYNSRYTVIAEDCVQEASWPNSHYPLSGLYDIIRCTANQT